MLRTLLPLLVLPLASCVIVSTDSDHDISGDYVSESTLAQIKTGATKEYVLALLGDPSRRTDVDEGTEVWRWSYTESQSSNSHILLLIDADNSRDVDHNTFVEFEDGIVTKAWRD